MLKGRVNPVTAYASETLAGAAREMPPAALTVGGEDVHFVSGHDGTLEGRAGDLSATIAFEYVPEYEAVSWRICLRNLGSEAIRDIHITPLLLRFDVDPARLLPRVRHMDGSFHYDACYPPRAFRLQEEAFMTHDHSKPVTIGGTHAGAHVPILQFAVDANGRLAGFFVGFEWSGSWELSAHWEQVSWSGEARSDFLIHGSMSLGDLEVLPGQTLELPRVHLGFFEGTSWSDLDNAQRRYIREHLSARWRGSVPIAPVSYDHWFGIYREFDLADLKRQASRAAELGCEYFCLDAAWYLTKQTFLDGLGNWETPDPRRFPRGKESIRELSDHVLSLGMGFGIWHLIQLAMEDTDAIRKHPHLFRRPEGGALPGYLLKLETPEGVQYALDILRTWIRDWHISWMRYESVPEDGLAYNQGYNTVIDTLLSEFPDLYIEDCNGGAQRLDLNMVTRTHGNWLNDHTSSAEVTRFLQTGALRFWPAHFLNMAVLAFRDRPEETATSYHVLSRMVGTLSFNGAIAEWSADAARMIREHVEIYKRIRHLHAQPVYFPLPQPRSVDDWDAVLYGDGSGEHQLLYVYRVAGPDRALLHGLPGPGGWSLLRSSSPVAALEGKGADVVVSLPPRGAALWIR